MNVKKTADDEQLVLILMSVIIEMFGTVLN